MPNVSPIAEYLRINKAIPIRSKSGCHFYSPEGAYLGHITKTIVNNYKVVSLDTFGEGMKKLHSKSVAIGQLYAYVKNADSPIGISIIPVKTYARKIFVDFLERTFKMEDSTKSFTNNLDLMAIDEKTGVGLYDTEKPFNYKKVINRTDSGKIKHNRFKHTVN